MDTTKFMRQIREIIREEIDFAMKKHLNESVKNIVSETIRKSSSVKTSAPIKKHSNVPQSLSTKKSNFSNIDKNKYGAIGSLLSNLENSREFREFEQANRGEPFSIIQESSTFSPIENAENDGIQVNDAIKRALTKDYSALLKKVDDHKMRRNNV